ncbi:MAG: APC family permease [Chitinophagales bacterium]|nr:APC family permease [Chitinophagales bacterium]
MSNHSTKKLNELSSTAICGNDISSSCLYVSALAILYAGQYAWISLLMVAFVLFLFRKIYGEVVGALPLNGGAYNALLNTTSKSTASLAATLTMLSYMATAVISASEAIHYFAHIVPKLNTIIEINFGIFQIELTYVILLTIVLLSLFMFLAIIGIGESAAVATGIFIFHLTSLVLLSGVCIFYLFMNGMDVFYQNNALPVKGGILTALYFGFAAAMLGISGFESSANFVEEQEKGVFPKTLRNMWIVVSVFNPLMAFLALSIIPVGNIDQHQESLLSYLGEVAGGHWLSAIISIDALLVLSGAVLTSYVGVGGLIERITLDRVMPNYFLKKNKRGSSYRIAIAFFLLCTSILLITKGKVAALAGVYTIAFLSVMALFGMGNILLKVKRQKLPRPIKSGWLSLVIAILAVLMAVIGNIELNPEYFAVFLKYFIPSILFVMFMLNRTTILKIIFNIVEYVFDKISSGTHHINKKILRMIADVSSQEFVFFTKGDDVATLNKVMHYIKKNEQTKRLKIVTVLPEGEHVNPKLLTDVEVLDRAYPEIKINFIEMEGKFGPELINELSEKWKIPSNFMFIGSPGDRFPYRIEELGGVRLII